MLQQGHSGALLLLSACKALHNAVTSASCAGIRGAALQEQLLPLAATAGALQQQHRHKHTVRMVLLQVRPFQVGIVSKQLKDCCLKELPP